MKFNGALGVVVVVAALSGSLLVGCSSDDEDNTPPPLVGTWAVENSDGIGVLQFKADGTCLYEAGDSRNTLSGYDACTYEADESTLTYLTSSYCDDSTDKATYTYTVTNDQVEFKNASGDDKCEPRKSVMEGAIWTMEKSSPSSSAS